MFLGGTLIDIGTNALRLHRDASIKERLSILGRTVAT